ncbi:PilZ domain-containing protein [Hahella sp. SMD15-11]|uniref:PilZ domain-containing protein n=1 Tax=Thermohahella caldifontis TaxID=3142973 RepID=A0AB39UVS7_9GAMM
MTQERRRYFRVADQVGLVWRRLADGESWEARQPLQASDVLMRLENEISALFESLRSTQPAVLEILELFNRKINLALSLDTRKEQEQLMARIKPVSLSACGIAFTASEPVPVGARLAMQLTLFPGNITLDLMGTVVARDQHSGREDEPWVIRADFGNIDSERQEILIQHVIRAQSRELRARREAREAGKSPDGA